MVIKKNYGVGAVSLSGQAAGAEAMGKAVLVAGNVRGQRRQYGRIAPGTGLMLHHCEGNILSAITRKFDGKTIFYPWILGDNREVVKDANLVCPGQKIRIPPG